ncbi:MAG: class II aldolase/adducin family protein [Chloroflexi bacterium]|nr:class II aldolase/adducin family protein [Chloroflexota bacterium]
MQSSDKSCRLELVKIAQKLVALGLKRGASGSVSARYGKCFLVTPAGVPVEDMSPDGMVAMDFSGAILGVGNPSSEWRFHCDILAARPEIGAVIYTQPRYAASLACLSREIPMFHYTILAVAGGDSIRCAPYALFGSQTLSGLAIQALENRKACLLGNHGMIAIGHDITDALAVAVEVEMLCELYWTALQVGEPNILTESQMQEALENFKSYAR